MKELCFFIKKPLQPTEKLVVFYIKALSSLKKKLENEKTP